MGTSTFCCRGLPEGFLSVSVAPPCGGWRLCRRPRQQRHRSWRRGTQQLASTVLKGYAVIFAQSRCAACGGPTARKDGGGAPSSVCFAVGLKSIYFSRRIIGPCWYPLTHTHIASLQCLCSTPAAAEALQLLLPRGPLAAGRGNQTLQKKHSFWVFAARIAAATAAQGPPASAVRVSWAPPLSQLLLLCGRAEAGASSVTRCSAIL